ncbi:MAG: radical SAM protein [Planctomycetota bacterium]|nr:MAG: radical SAM protein [Planctomycetota bacterium]
MHGMHSTAPTLQGTTAAPALRLVFWESTISCNLTCSHCRRLTTDAAASKHDLSTTQAQELISDIGRIGPAILVFSGGEALMRQDLFTLIDHAHACGLTPALASNGALIDDAMAARIKDHGVHRVAISLDGADAQTHDHLRGIPGSFDAACAALRRLKALGVSTQINATISRLNMAQRDALADLACTLEADALHCFILVPVGCGGEIDPAIRLNPGETEVFLRWLAQRSINSPVFIKATCAPQYHRILRQQEIPAQHSSGNHHLSRMSRGCLAGRNVCFVSHDGEVFPCGYLPLSAGSIHQQSLSEIWSDALLFQGLRDDDRLQGRCGACDHQDICGGCRARSWAESENAWAEDPSCPYHPRAGQSDSCA